jgi:hypothetical protein
MKDINEFREGNILYDEEDESLVKVIKVENGHVKEAHYLRGYERPLPENYFESLKPVPLTEEIFSKIDSCERIIYPGNRDHKEYKIFIPKDFSYSLNFNFSFIQKMNQKSIWCLSSDPSIEIEVENLHQLQNLIFKLTGKELTFNY